MNVFLLSSSVNTGDSHALHEKLQGEGWNEPLDRVWQWRLLAWGLCCTAVLCPRGPVAHEAGSCTSPAVPRAGLCCSPSLPGLACVQPSMVRGRRLVFGRPESRTGAVPCCLSKQGKCFWDYSWLIKRKTEFCSAYEEGHRKWAACKPFSFAGVFSKGYV